MTATVIINSKNAKDGLARMYKAAINLKPMLKNIGEGLEKSTEQRLEDERSPDGTPFAPLNPFYALTKKGPHILRESGELATIVYQLAGIDAVEVGSRSPFALVHQEGRVIKPKTAAALVFSLGGNKVIKVKSVTIPARPFVGISEQDEVMIEETALDHFKLALAAGDRVD